jgi:hypothetical protein
LNSWETRVWTAACRVLVSQTNKDVACNVHTSEGVCKANTANECAWIANNVPACASNASSTELAKCQTGAKGPSCDYLLALLAYCPTSTTKAACDAKPGCAYQSDVCMPNEKKATLLFATVAKTQGSSYADKIIEVNGKCSQVTGGSTACTGTRVGNSADALVRDGTRVSNSADALVRAGSLVAAVVAALVLVL